MTSFGIKVIEFARFYTSRSHLPFSDLSFGHGLQASMAYDRLGSTPHRYRQNHTKVIFYLNTCGGLVKQNLFHNMIEKFQPKLSILQPNVWTSPELTPYPIMFHS